MKLFRKGGLILFLILGLLTAAGIYFLTDDFIESQLEQTLSVQNGAMVEFDGFTISFFGGTMGWQKLQVADSEDLMKNKFETGKTGVSIQAWKLLQKKVIIDKVQISDILTGTARSKSGELPKEWIPAVEPVDSTESELSKEAKERTKAAKAALSNEIKNQPLFQLANTSVNTDSLMAMLKLESPHKIDSLKQAISAQVDGITKSVDDLKINQTVSDLDTKLKAINIKEIKDVKAAENAIKSLETMAKDTKELKTRMETAKTELSNGTKLVTSGTGKVDDWIQDDYKKAREAAKLPDFDSQKIGELLLGKELMQSINEYLGYAETGREYLAYFKSEEQEKVEEPQRLKGQDIRFPLREANPNFWIKQVDVNLTTPNAIQLKGEIKDIIDNQKLIKRPTTLAFSGTNNSGESLNLTGEFNYLGEKTKEQFVFTMPKMSLRTVALGGGGSLPNGFTKGNAAITADLTVLSGAPTALISMKNTEVDFKFDKAASGKSEKTFRNIMDKINSFDVTAKVASNAKGLKIAIDSDIDDQVSRQIKAVANEEVNKVKKQIQAKVDAEVNAKKQELNKLVDEQKQKLEAQKKAIESKVNEQLAAFDAKKKELEAKKDELIKQTTGKAKDLIKSKIKL